MIEEITAVFKHFQMWSLLGWYDVKHRYRRSLIGPFWITISTGVMVAMIGMMFSKIFKTDVAEFLPHFAVGQIIWLLISTQINDACVTFVQYQSVIKQVPVPLTVHVLRRLWCNFILFLHNFIIVIIVLVLFGRERPLPSWHFIPGLALVLMLLFFLSVILAIVCARFRDVTQIVGVFLQLAYFFTPIFWMKKVLSGKYLLVTELNPCYHMIEVVRAPLLGSAQEGLHGIFIAACIVVSAVMAFGLMKKLRDRVAYWL
ncbi:MAG TPA: ABC transporter permease [Smithella sp.]|nr:ABC transporter permease [Smithella sp.]HRS97837.1 ABC transporter permease [Smithella sp.]